MTSTRKRTASLPSEVSSLMMSAMPWSKRDTLAAREGARPLVDWETDWMTVCAPWKPRLRSCRAASRRWQGLESSMLPCMTSMRKRTMCRPSLVSSRMMSARGLGISSVWCSVANICSTVMGVGGWGQGAVGGEGGWLRKGQARLLSHWRHRIQATYGMGCPLRGPFRPTRTRRSRITQKRYWRFAIAVQIGALNV